MARRHEAECHNIVDSAGRGHYLSGMTPDDTLDARGLLCPLPVMKLRKRLGSAAPGGVVELWADDPAAVLDVEHFCAESGQEYLGLTECDGYNAFRVRKR